MIFDITAAYPKLTKNGFSPPCDGSYKKDPSQDTEDNFAIEFNSLEDFIKADFFKKVDSDYNVFEGKIILEINNNTPKITIYNGYIE